jgi:hypothetical protein
MIEFIVPEWLHLEGVASEIPFALGGITTDGQESALYADVPVTIISSGSSMIAFGDGFQEPSFRERLNNYLSAFSSDQPLAVGMGISFDTISLSTKDKDLILTPFPMTLTIFCSDGTLLKTFTWKDTIAGIFQSYLQSAISHVPDSAFQSTDKKAELLNKVNAFTAQFADGAWQGAQQKLVNDIMAKFDGASGGNPKNDWIIDEFEAGNLHGIFSKVLAVVEYLNE